MRAKVEPHGIALTLTARTQRCSRSVEVRKAVRSRRGRRENWIGRDGDEAVLMEFGSTPWWLVTTMARVSAPRPRVSRAHGHSDFRSGSLFRRRQTRESTLTTRVERRSRSRPTGADDAQCGRERSPRTTHS